MKKTSVIKRIFGVFNPKTLLGYDQLKSGSQVITSAFHENFSVKSASRQETFEEALLRLNLTEAEIAQRGRFMHGLSLFFLLATLIVYSYVSYLLWVGSWLAAFTGAAIGTYTIAQTFRYHFWFFQIKRRQLGCTFKQWLYQGVLGLKP